MTTTKNDKKLINELIFIHIDTFLCRSILYILHRVGIILENSFQLDISYDFFAINYLQISKWLISNCKML